MNNDRLTPDEDFPPEAAAQWAEAPTPAEFLSDELLSDVTQIYLNEIGQNALLSPEQERYYAQLARTGDFAARQKMIEHNLRLVVHVAKHYVHRGVALLDLIEEGNLGLMHALDKFEPERGFRFSTYATWWIRQNIERAIMNQSRTIRLPVHVIKELNVALRALRHLETHGGREPAMEDVAHLLDWPLQEVRRVLSHNERIASLDAPLEIDPLLSFGESIADDANPTPDVRFERAEVEDYVRGWLSQLQEKQRRVIEHRYGLNGREVYTLERLATELGLTRERVRQIQIEALHALRRIIKRKGVAKEVLL
jgi:RNA polymerase nonessential primary-like sigma factor